MNPVLMSFTGEDQNMGAFLPDLKKFAKKAANRTPQALLFKKMRSLAQKRRTDKRPVVQKNLFTQRTIPVVSGKPSYYFGGGEDDLYMGAFLPGLMKVVRKIGKVTSPITTAIAKKIMPSSVVDALAKVDPSSKKLTSSAVIQAAQDSMKKPAAAPSVSPQVQAAIKTATDPKIIAIALGGVVALALLSKKRR